MRVKLALSLLASLLALLCARAQDVSVATDPAAPSQTDVVRLDFARDFPTPCYQTTANFNRNGNTIEVQITSTPQNLICPQVITAQTAAVEVGLLKPGTYQVLWAWHGVPGRGSIAASFSFQVLPTAPLAPTLNLRGKNIVELRFQSVAHATYQAQWSPDLRRWFDLGSPVIGTGEDIPVEDSRNLATNRFYRIRQTADPPGSK